MNSIYTKSARNSTNGAASSLPLATVAPIEVARRLAVLANSTATKSGVRFSFQQGVTTSTIAIIKPTALAFAFGGTSAATSELRAGDTFS